MNSTKRTVKEIIYNTLAQDITEEERKYLKEIVELGPDYAHFMNAQIAHKNLKKIKKIIRIYRIKKYNGL